MIDSATASAVAATREIIKNGALRRTIIDLLQQGHDSETVAQVMGVPVDIVEQISIPAPNPPLNSTLDSASNDANATCAAVEQQFRGLSDAATQVISELMIGAESEAIRYASAKFALEVAHGGALRPKVDSGNGNLTQINFIVQQATETYQRQLRNAAQPNITIDVAD